MLSCMEEDLTDKRERSCLVRFLKVRKPVITRISSDKNTLMDALKSTGSSPPQAYRHLCWEVINEARCRTENGRRRLIKKKKMP